VITVAILGSGNVGHALGALLPSHIGRDVVIWGRRWWRPRTLSLSAVTGGRLCATGIARVEPDARHAVSGADIVILAVPAHARHALLKTIAPSIGPATTLIAWEGAGRLRESLRALGLDRHMAIGLQRSPLACRIVDHGHAVELRGVRSSVVAAAVDPAHRAITGALLKQVTPFRFRVAPDYACVSLSPGNPLIHPARLYALAAERRRPLRGLRFYGDWDDAASGTLLALHAELASVRDRLCLPRAFVTTLADRPRPPTPSELTREVRGEQGLADVPVPLRRSPGGHQLDLDHRYLREDVGESLAYMTAIARAHGARMPVAERIVDWYAAAMKGPPGRA
jgi:hypothetical protein